MRENLSPFKACHKINGILDMVFTSESDRFPVDIDFLATEVHTLFKWNDPISQIKGASVEGFEGALFKNNSDSWSILYNSSITSSQRIRFTKAHEIGHYVLHRTQQDIFQCSAKDMNLSGKDIEKEANEFASGILVPISDLKTYIEKESFNLNIIRHLSQRYDVSLEAMLVRWVRNTPESMLVIIFKDGFMKWAVSSSKAMKAGAYFPTKTVNIETPMGTLSADKTVHNCLEGSAISSQLWFPKTSSMSKILEYKMTHERYDRIITVLKLPNKLSVWDDS